DLARERKVRLPSQTEEGLRAQVFRPRYLDLGEYLEGFRYLTAVLQDAEALERASFELAEDCQAEGVRYLEVRFAPQLHGQPGCGGSRACSWWGWTSRGGRRAIRPTTTARPTRWPTRRSSARPSMRGRTTARNRSSRPSGTCTPTGSATGPGSSTRPRSATRG